MKRSLFVLTVFAQFYVNAQEHTGIYVNPSVGMSAGGFNANTLPPNGIYTNENWSYKAGAGFKVGLTAGYQRPRWSVNTGAMLLDQWSYGTDNSYWTNNRSETIQMRYLLFPLSISYRAKLPHKGRHVWLVTSVGIEIGRLAACLMDYKETVSNGQGLFSGTHESYEHEIMSKDELNILYNCTNFWINGKLDVEISNKKGSAWTVGPEFHYMISNLSKLGNNEAHAYAISVNIGYKLLWH